MAGLRQRRRTCQYFQHSSAMRANIARRATGLAPSASSGRFLPKSRRISAGPACSPKAPRPRIGPLSGLCTDDRSPSLSGQAGRDDRLACRLFWTLHSYARIACRSCKGHIAASFSATTCNRSSFYPTRPTIDSAVSLLVSCSSFLPLIFSRRTPICRPLQRAAPLRHAKATRLSKQWRCVMKLFARFFASRREANLTTALERQRLGRTMPGQTAAIAASRLGVLVS